MLVMMTSTRLPVNSGILAWLAAPSGSRAGLTVPYLARRLNITTAMSFQILKVEASVSRLHLAGITGSQPERELRLITRTPIGGEALRTPDEGRPLGLEVAP